MNGIANCEFERLFRQGENPVHLSATFCLLWVAAVDGVVDDDERRLILQIGDPPAPRPISQNCYSSSANTTLVA